MHNNTEIFFCGNKALKKLADSTSNCLASAKRKFNNLNAVSFKLLNFLLAEARQLLVLSANFLSALFPQKNISVLLCIYSFLRREEYIKTRAFVGYTMGYYLASMPLCGIACNGK